MDSNYCNNELAMAWIDLSYVKKNLFFGSKSAQAILSSLSGQIHFGSLTALMGPSGAGKTTLLNCINMRIKPNELTPDSQLWVNKYVPLKTCLIAQDQKEHLLMGLTVRESLLFASKIKNGFNRQTKSKSIDVSTQTGKSLLDSEVIELSSIVTESFNNDLKCAKHSTNNNTDTSYQKLNFFDHSRNCNRIISELLLTDCATNLVNDCSGGEQKRLSIGLELVASVNNPNLICIDEPTSGLDSNSAELVILCLNQLSRKHSIAIVTSIHQPNSLVMSMFDQLYVLSKGKCVYCGPPNQLRTHLQAYGISVEQENMPIEVLLKMCSTQTIKSRQKSRIGTITSWIAGELEHTVEINTVDIARLIELNNEKKSDIESDCNASCKRLHSALSNRKQVFTLSHFYFLLLRGFTCLARYQWRVYLFLASFSLVFSLSMIPLFGADVGEDNGCVALTIPMDANETVASSALKGCDDPIALLNQESRVMLNLNCQFFAMTFLQFVTSACMVLTYPIEVKVFLIEHHNNWYSTSSYFWSKTFTEIPILLVICYIYTFIVYYGTGQITDTDWRFIYFSLIHVLGQFTASGIGILVGIIFARNFQMAITSGVGVFLVIIMFSGYFIPLKTLPKLFRDASNLSFVKLTFESVMITLYGYDRCEHNNIQLILFKLGIDDDMLQTHLWWLLGHVIVWRILALMVLIIRANNFSICIPLKNKH